MRSIWKGAISFGMVTIPVKLYTATESKDVRFRLLHKEDHAPIEEKRFCTADGKEVAWDDLVRGYEVSKGEFIVLDPEEIDAAKPESSTIIDIGDFVEAEEIDPIYFEKSYFLEPTEVGAKPFSLLKRALEETERFALARVTIRTRERLATLRAYEDTLMLETMFWPDEIRSTGALDLPEGAETKVRAKEMEMARSLVANLADRFRPESYTDAYRTALEELIEQKMRGETHPSKRRKPEPKVIDLMDALKASVDAAKAGGSKPKKKTARRKTARRSAA
ncbi:MAG: non-homologous end joining protein Ku [Chloroflexota bacterium]